jgi:hypothetical protein
MPVGGKGRSYLSDAYCDILDKHQKLVKDWNRFVWQYNRVVAPRPSGRPLAASDAQIADVVKRRKAGASLRAIVANTGLGLRTVRSILAGAQGTAELRKREFDRHRAADYRALTQAADQRSRNFDFAILRRGRRSQSSPRTAESSTRCPAPAAAASPAHGSGCGS